MVRRESGEAGAHDDTGLTRILDQLNVLHDLLRSRRGLLNNVSCRTLEPSAGLCRDCEIEWSVTALMISDGF
jgi:hypothetical protein